MKIVPFEPEHLKALTVQRQQLGDLLIHGDRESYAQNLANAGVAVTGMEGDEVIFCIGRVELWKGRHTVWALMSQSAGKKMFGIVKAIRRLIDVQDGLGRLEFYVRADFKEGCKLADIMKFKMHHYEERFLPDGSDAFVYVRYV